MEDKILIGIIFLVLIVIYIVIELKLNAAPRLTEEDIILSAPRDGLEQIDWGKSFLELDELDELEELDELDELEELEEFDEFDELEKFDEELREGSIVMKVMSSGNDAYTRVGSLGIVLWVGHDCVKLELDGAIWFESSYCLVKIGEF